MPEIRPHSRGKGPIIQIHWDQNSTKSCFHLEGQLISQSWDESKWATDDFPKLEENDCWIFPAGLRPFAPPYKANSGPPVIFAFAHHPVRGLRKYEKERQLCDGNKISKENEITYSLSLFTFHQIDYYMKNVKKQPHSPDKILKGYKKAAKSDQWLISDGNGDRGLCL